MIPVSPRERTLQELVQHLDPLLDVDCEADNGEAICQHLQAITGTNSDPYMHPETVELADDFIRSFMSNDNTRSPEVFFYVEAGTLEAVEEVYPAWFEAIFGGHEEDMLEIDLVELFPHLAEYGAKFKLIQTLQGRRFIVTSSLFQAFAPKTALIVMQRCVVEFMCLIELLGRVGLHSEDYVLQNCAVFQSYLMNLSFGQKDTSLSTRRLNDLPRCVVDSVMLHIGDHYLGLTRRISKYLRHTKDWGLLYWPRKTTF